MAHQHPPSSGADTPRGDQPEAGRAHAALDLRTFALAMVTAAATIGLLYFAREVLIPIVLAVLASLAFAPVVEWLVSHRVPRALAAALILSAITGAAGAGAYALSDDAMAVLDRLPEAAQRVRRALTSSRENDANVLQKMKEAAQEIERTAEEAAGTGPPQDGTTRVQIDRPAFDAQDLWWGPMSLVELSAQLVLIFFLLFFLLATGDVLRRKLLLLAGPTFARKQAAVDLLDQITEQVERFLLVRFLTAIVVGVATWLALWWLGLQQPGVWGIAAGVFNSVPYFGPVIVTIGLAVVAIVQFGSALMTFYVCAAALAITSLEGWLLTPALMGKAAHMNATAIFLGLIFWGWIWGIWGLLLAVPIMIVVKATCDHIETLRPVAELLGD